MSIINSKKQRRKNVRDALTTPQSLQNHMEPCLWGLLTRTLFNLKKLQTGLSLKLDMCIYSKITKINPWDKIYQRAFLVGFYSRRGLLIGAHTHQ